MTGGVSDPPPDAVMSAYPPKVKVSSSTKTDGGPAAVILAYPPNVRVSSRTKVAETV